MHPRMLILPLLYSYMSIMSIQAFNKKDYTLPKTNPKNRLLHFAGRGKLCACQP